jgi:hypothetical protein
MHRPQSEFVNGQFVQSHTVDNEKLLFNELVHGSNGTDEIIRFMRNVWIQLTDKLLKLYFEEMCRSCFQSMDDPLHMSDGEFSSALLGLIFEPVKRFGTQSNLPCKGLFRKMIGPAADKSPVLLCEFLEVTLKKQAAEGIGEDLVKVLLGTLNEVIASKQYDNECTHMYKRQVKQTVDKFASTHGLHGDGKYAPLCTFGRKEPCVHTMVL